MTYTVLINSSLRAGGDIANAQYLFDWGVFNDDVKYKVYIQFVSSVLTSTFDKIPSLFIELGASKTFVVNRDLTIAQSSQFVGQLYKVETKTSPYLISESNSEAIEIYGRPQSKAFSVRLLTDDGQPFTSSTTFSYTIKLTFKEIEE